jgi:hypothetical protein
VKRVTVTGTNTRQESLETTHRHTISDNLTEDKRCPTLDPSDTQNSERASERDLEGCKFNGGQLDQILQTSDSVIVKPPSPRSNDLRYKDSRYGCGRLKCIDQRQILTVQIEDRCGLFMSFRNFKLIESESEGPTTIILDYSPPSFPHRLFGCGYLIVVQIPLIWNENKYLRKFAGELKFRKVRALTLQPLACIGFGCLQAHGYRRERIRRDG